MFCDFLKIPKHPAGFTLAELLISLAILGVIATFTIPKILSTQQNGQYNAEAKEVAAMISEAFQKAKQDGVIFSSSVPSVLLPYINYVSPDTSTVIDVHPNWGGGGPNGSGGVLCGTSSINCYRLHNGGMLGVVNAWGFGGTSALNSVYILFDPDATASGSNAQTAPGKAVMFILYYNGQITTVGLQKAGSCNSGGCGNSPGPYDPSWFSWN